MLQLRARGFALRDGFADTLRGVITREEAADMPPVEEQVRKATSDLPWLEAEAPSKEATRDDDLTAALEASLEDAALDEDAAPVSGSVAAASDTSLPSPSASAEGGAASSPPTTGRTGPYEDFVLINERDRRKFHACRELGGHTVEQAKKWLELRFGIQSTTEIHLDWLDGICERMKDPEPL
jgi:hypothetical protein